MATSDMKSYPFSTPINAYKSFGPYKLASYGETIWQYPDGAFTYGRFRMKMVRYNVVMMDLGK
jgi:hypothetical protein